jgi:hypothetical protein
MKESTLFKAALIFISLLFLTSCDTGVSDAVWLHGTWVHYDGNNKKTGPTRDGWNFRANGDAVWFMTDTKEVLLDCSYRVSSENNVLVLCPGYKREEIYRQYNNPKTLILDSVGAIWHKIL